MGTLINDEPDYTAFATGPRKPLLGFIFTRIAGKVKASIGVTVRTLAPTTQAQIDGREPNWERDSESTVAKMRRLGI